MFVYDDLSGIVSLVSMGAVRIEKENKIPTLSEGAIIADSL